MVKKNSKQRSKKIDVSDAVALLEKKNIDKEVKQKEIENSLFFVDTKGSNEGLSLSAKKAISDLTASKLEPSSAKNARKNNKPLSALQKLRQGKLSAHETNKIEKRVKKDDNFEKHDQDKKVYKRKKMFDLWGDAVPESGDAMESVEETNPIQPIDTRDMGETGTTKIVYRSGPVKKSQAEKVEIRETDIMKGIKDEEKKESSDKKSSESDENSKKESIDSSDVKTKTKSKSDKESETTKSKSIFKFSKTTHDIEHKNKGSFINTQSVLKPQKVPYTVGIKENNGNIPALLLPTGSGLSINPGQNAFDNEVEKVYAHELSDYHKEEDLIRKMKPMTAKLLDQYTKEELRNMTDREKLVEYRKLMVGDQKDAGEEDGYDETRSAHKPLDKLTKIQRNKQLRAKENIKKESQERLERQLLKQIGQVPNLIREIEEEDKAKRLEREYKKELIEKTNANPETSRATKIGRNRFEETTKVLPKKVTSSLRTAQIGSGETIKVTKKGGKAGNSKNQQALVMGQTIKSGSKVGAIGSALMDRVHSLQRRNMVELPPSADKQTLLRVKKKGKKQSRGASHKQARLKIED